MKFSIIEKSPFIKDLQNNLPTILLCYLAIIIFISIIKHYFLKKDLIMSIIHSILIGGLVSL